MSTESERRAAARVPVEMWVEEASANAVYFQRTANVSMGGLYLEHSVPHAVGTRMELRFTLPGDDVQVHTVAEIVKIEQVEAIGMHLKFVDLPAPMAERIDRYIGQHLDG